MPLIHVLRISGIDGIQSFVIIFQMKKLRGKEIKELPNGPPHIQLGTTEQAVESEFLHHKFSDIGATSYIIILVFTALVICIPYAGYKQNNLTLDNIKRLERI